MYEKHLFFLSVYYNFAKRNREGYVVTRVSQSHNRTDDAKQRELSAVMISGREVQLAR